MKNNYKTLINLMPPSAIKEIIEEIEDHNRFIASELNLEDDKYLKMKSIRDIKQFQLIVLDLKIKLKELTGE